MVSRWRCRERVAYKVVLAEEVRRVINDVTFGLRRAWDLRMNLLIDNPLPRDGGDFAVVPVINRFGDRYLSLIVDEFPFTVDFDVYAWPEIQDNPLDFQGIVNIFSLGGA